MKLMFLQTKEHTKQPASSSHDPDRFPKMEVTFSAMKRSLIGPNRVTLKKVEYRVEFIVSTSVVTASKVAILFRGLLPTCPKMPHLNTNLA